MLKLNSEYIVGTRLSSTSSSSKLYAEKPEEKAKTGHQEVKTVASEVCKIM